MLAPDGTFASLRLYTTMRWLLGGTLCTNTAFWMYQIAIGWLALQLTDSALWVGLAGFAGGIPMLILALPAGVIIDRFDRRLVLLFAQCGVMTVAAIFTILIFTDVMNRWLMLVLAFGYGTSMAFVFPTRQAIVGTLVDRSYLANAIALISATQNATRIFGPALAGIFIAVIGISGTFAIAAGLQIIAMITTLKLPVTKWAQSKRGPMLESLTEGLRYVARDPVLFGTVLLATVGTLFIMPYLSIMPVFVRNVMELGSGTLGTLMMFVGLGAVLGALGVASFRRLTAARGFQVTLIATFAVIVLLFSQSTSWIAISVALLFLSGVVSAGFLATNQTVLQLRTDEAVRGRVLSVNMLTWGMLPFGQLPLGVVADWLGAPVAVTIWSLIALILIALIAWRVPQLRRSTTAPTD